MRTQHRRAWLFCAAVLAALTGCGVFAHAGDGRTATPATSYRPGPGFADPTTLGWVKSSAPLPDAIAGAPGAPGTLYTCTGAGGQGGQGPITLSVSTDGGASWQTKDTGIPLARCLSLAVSPATPQSLALYAGTCRSDCGQGHERLYLSPDAGAHWTQVTPSSSGDAGAVFGWLDGTFFANAAPDGTPASSTQFLAVSRDGVHFTWTSLPAVPQQLFAAGSTLYAVAGASATCSASLGACTDLYRSSDLGASWSRITPAYHGNNISAAALVPGSSTLVGYDARAFSGQNAYPMLRSANGGASWQPLPDAPAGLQTSSDSPIATPDGTIFVTLCCGASGGSPSSGIYKLAPGASAWALVSPVVPAQVRLTAVSWDTQGHPAKLWGLRVALPNTSASVTEIWSHPA
jgi:photosystem II stability/assembly factor-like uncharacterized protein